MFLRQLGILPRKVEGEAVIVPAKWISTLTSGETKDRGLSIQHFIRLGRLLQANIDANRELAEENRQADEEYERRRKLVQQGKTDFGPPANVEFREYQPLSFGEVARRIGLKDASALTIPIGRLEEEFGEISIRKIVEGKPERTGELTPKAGRSRLSASCSKGRLS